MDELTKKQKGFVKDFVETGNGVQSALNNYDTEDYSTAGNIASENLDKPKIQAAIKSIAEQIPDKKIHEVLMEGLEAKFTDKFNADAPDYAVRHKYVDTALKLKGLYEPDEQRNINILMPVLVKFLDKKDNEGSDSGNTERVS